MEYKHLKNIAQITMGQSPKSETYNNKKEGLPFFQGNADFGEISPKVRIWCSVPKKVAHKNDILISVRAPIGALNIADTECCIGRGLAAISVRNIKDRDYIFNALKAKSEYLKNRGTGSTFKAINKNILEDVEIPIVSTEKRDIEIKVLNKLNIVKKQKEKELSKLDTLIKARFVEMFGDIKNNKNYNYKPISDLTNVVSGGTPKRDVKEYWDRGTIPWVKTTELKNNKVNSTEEYITKTGLQNSSAKLVPSHTILIAMYGQGKTRGMTAYLEKEAATNQACACILPSSKINSEYLWQYLIMSYEELRNLAKGGNQPNLNSRMIKDFPILDPPIALQNKFVSFIHQVDKSKVAIQKSLDETQTLFDSLMQKYFS